MSLKENEVEFERLFFTGALALSKQDYTRAKAFFTSAVRALNSVIALSTGNERNSREGMLIELNNQLKDIDRRIANEESKMRVSKALSVSGSDNKTFEMEPAKVPNVSFDEIAGLENVKKAVKYKAIYPYLHRELYRTLHKKVGGGVLLYGLPGTGKTMVAKAIAHETGAAFYPVRGSDFSSKWFGESEKNIRALFDEAKQQEKAVIFFDEIEAYTSRNSDESVMARVVSELLSQMQGISADGSESKILFIAATNCPWEVDSAFLRPGRFDEVICVDLPDREARKQVLHINLKGVPITDDIDYDYLAECTSGFNAADVEYLCEKAKESVIERCIKNPETTPAISMQDFLNALKNVKSSVIPQDIIKIEGWKKNH